MREEREGERDGGGTERKSEREARLSRWLLCDALPEANLLVEALDDHLQSGQIALLAMLEWLLVDEPMSQPMSHVRQPQYNDRYHYLSWGNPAPQVGVCSGELCWASTPCDTKGKLQSSDCQAALGPGACCHRSLWPHSWCS